MNIERFFDWVSESFFRIIVFIVTQFVLFGLALSYGVVIPLNNRQCRIESNMMGVTYKFDWVQGMCFIPLNDGTYIELDRYRQIKMEKNHEP